MSNTPRIVISKRQLNNELRRLQETNEKLSRDLQESNSRYMALEGDYYDLMYTITKKSLFLALFSAFRLWRKDRLTRKEIVKQA